MDTKKLVTLVGKVLTVTAGVLVAFQVQTYMDRSRVSAPTTAE
jgi:hypothetical protein|tara:strand:+ start:2517 stop:2645 length:129 start_codon:yes stop_codon:yes gene_type:complete